MQNINRALKQIRLFHNLTQAEMGSKTKTSQVFISKIESGETVSLLTLSRYAKALNIPEWQLLFFSENMQSKNIKSEIYRKFVVDKVLKILAFISKNAEIEELKKDL